MTCWERVCFIAATAVLTGMMVGTSLLLIYPAAQQELEAKLKESNFDFLANLRLIEGANLFLNLCSVVLHFGMNFVAGDEEPASLASERDRKSLSTIDRCKIYLMNADIVRVLMAGFLIACKATPTTRIMGAAMSTLGIFASVSAITITSLVGSAARGEKTARKRFFSAAKGTDIELDARKPIAAEEKVSLADEGSGVDYVALASDGSVAMVEVVVNSPGGPRG